MKGDDLELLCKNKAVVWNLTTKPIDILKQYAAGSQLEKKYRFYTTVNIPNKI